MELSDKYRWSDSYRVGHAQIDHQHFQLFELLSELEQALTECRGPEAVLQGMRTLSLYAKQHFDDEERWMERISYPQRASHRQQHQLFMAEVDRLNDELKMGQPVLTIELVQFVKRWLVDHIQGADMKIRDFHQAQPSNPQR